jgi:hypothetical protein
MMMTSTVPIAGFQFDLVFDPAAVLGLGHRRARRELRL